MAGYAIVFAAALASGSGGPGEYRHGTHAESVYEQNTTRVVFASTRGVRPALPTWVTNAQAPQLYDLTLQGGVHEASASIQGLVRPLVAGYPTDTSQLAAQLFPPAAFHPVVSGPRVNVVLAAPQADPTQLAPQFYRASFGPEGPVRPNEYHHGLHAQATYESNTTRAIFAPAVAPATLVQGPVPALIVTVSQGDPTTPSLLFGCATQHGLPSPSVVAGTVFSFGTHAYATYEANTTRWVAAVPVNEGFLFWTVYGEPQDDPTQIQGAIFEAAVNPPRYGLVPRLIQGGVPPTDPSQIAARIFAPTVPPPAIIPGPLAGFFTTLPQFEERTTQKVWPAQIAGVLPTIIPQWVTLPQFEERPTQVIWPAVRAGLLPRSIPLMQGAPQLIDLSPQGFVHPVATVRQGRVPPLVQGAPQLVDLTQQATFFRVLPRPPVPPPIKLIMAAPQLVDLTIQGWVRKAIPPGSVARVPPLLVAPGQIDLTPPSLVWASAQPMQASVPPLIWAAPQLLDLTQQGWIEGASTQSQGGVPPLTVGVPPQSDLTQQALVFVGAALQPFVPTPLSLFSDAIILRTHPLVWPYNAEPQPYCEYYQYVGDIEVYGIDWTGIKANRWAAGASVALGAVIQPTVANGYQATCTQAGATSVTEPYWPPYVGGVVQDGSAQWTIEAVDNTSLSGVLQSATWSAPDGGVVLTNNTIVGQVAFVTINANGVSGLNYPVLCTAMFSDGTELIGKLLIKVR